MAPSQYLALKDRRKDITAYYNVRVITEHYTSANHDVDIQAKKTTTQKEMKLQAQEETDWNLRRYKNVYDSNR